MKEKKKNLITKELCDLRIYLPMLNILFQQLQYLHVHRGECDDWLMCMKSFCVVKCWFIGRPSAWLYLSTTVISRIWIFRNVHINTVIVENRCPGIYSSWEFFSWTKKKVSMVLNRYFWGWTISKFASNNLWLLFISAKESYKFSLDMVSIVWPSRSALIPRLDTEVLLQLCSIITYYQLALFQTVALLTILSKLLLSCEHSALSTAAFTTTAWYSFSQEALC